MNNSVQHKKIAQFALKKLADSLSPAESLELKEWLDSNSRNKVVFERLLEQSAIAENYKHYKAIDYKAALLKAKQQLGIETRIVRLKKLWQYAAAVFVPLMLFFVTYYLLNNNDATDSSRSLSFNDITMPGQAKAFVRLEDGSMVELSNGIGQVIAGNSYSLVKDSLNKLTYAAPETGLSEEILKTKIHTIVTPKGGEFNVVLSDGSKLWLNAMSEVSYPIVFGDDKREVYIRSGEVYFEVSKDAGRPFIIKTLTSQVQVLGTCFNYRSYQDESADEVTLEEGSVKLIREDKSLSLQPGQQALVSKGNNTIVVKEVNTSLYSSWRDGKLDFHRMPLNRIASNLSRWYNVDFNFESDSLQHVRFSGGVYKNKSIEFILALIEETTAVKFTVSNNAILVQRK